MGEAHNLDAAQYQDPIESFGGSVMVMDVIRIYEKKIVTAQQRLKLFTRGGLHRKFGRKLIEQMLIVLELEDKWLSTNAEQYLPVVAPRQRPALEAQLNAARENYKGFFLAAIELIQTEPTDMADVHPPGKK